MTNEAKRALGIKTGQDANEKLVAEIVAEKLVLRKRQESAGEYTSNTFRRGGSTTMVVSKKQEPQTYNGIDI